MSIVTESLPAGVVTLVLGDVVGSVGLWERHGTAMHRAMARAEELIDGAVRRHGGARPTEQGEGDNFVAAFARASDALSCACELQRCFVEETWPAGLDLRYRLGVHTGELDVDTTNRYAGPTINRCARIRDLAGGGQTLLSTATVALAADAMPPAATTRYVGRCELRGIARPEEIHQLIHPDLDDAIPELASPVTTGLPTPSSQFVGRSRELEELRGNLTRSRIVTITGAGGSGKSRLALEFARAQSATRSVWLVELAPVTNPSIVARVVADAIGAELAGGADPLDAALRKLSRFSSLVIIDNSEHLLEACASLVSTLVGLCPELTVVATSREPLGIDGEVTYRIPSLSMPDAVALFVDRARRADTTFELTEATAGPVTEICHRVDRLPLAIELAAARCRALTVSQIARGINEHFRLLTGGPRDALPRQRSLEASVAWSFDLLTPAERLVLARLSVFAGSFSLAGAVAVCGDDDDVDDLVDGVTGLVDRSLVQVESSTDGDPRYRLLEAIRAYARERLTELDEPATIRDRHLTFAVQLAGTAGVGFVTDASRWRPVLDAELDNLRAAIEWAGSSGRPDLVVGLIERLAAYGAVRGLWLEADRALRGVVFSDDVSAAERARGMATAAMFASLSGDFPGSFEFACDACNFAEQVGDDGELMARAVALRAWAGFSSGCGSNDQIAADVRATLGRADASDDPVLASTILFNVGFVQTWLSVDEGRATLGRALALAQGHGLVTSELSARSFLLQTGIDGRVAAFRENADALVTSLRAFGADAMLSFALSTVGYTEAFYGDEPRARVHVSEAIDAATRAGLALQEHFALRSDAIVEARFGDPRAAIAKAVDVVQRVRCMTAGIEKPMDEWVAGSAARRAGDPTSARGYFEAALAGSGDPTVRLVEGRSHLGLALLDLAEDDIDAAWERAYDGLEALAVLGDRLGVLDAVDVIAAVAVASDSDSDSDSDSATLAARLLGATDALRTELGVTPFTMTEDERSAALVHVREIVADGCHDLLAEGERLSFDDMIAFARRGRGRRNRPTTGWQSLTPTELEVVRLVAQGHQNAEIAKALIMSVNTVKTHLSHVYAKLGTSSRAELAAQAVTQQL